MYERFEKGCYCTLKECKYNKGNFSRGICKPGICNAPENKKVFVTIDGFAVECQRRTRIK